MYFNAVAKAADPEEQGALTAAGIAREVLKE